MRAHRADPFVTGIRDAMRGRLLVEFSYLRQHRIVQPAELGLHRVSGRLTLRGYQVGGRSNSRRPPFWMLFPADLLEDFLVSEQAFVDDPPDYRSGDGYVDPVFAAL